jgi:hypothetical protein
MEMGMRLVAATASSFAAKYGWRMLRGTLDEATMTGELEQIGVNANELISADRREPMTGNPMHKYNPGRIEKQVRLTVDS